MKVMIERVKIGEKTLNTFLLSYLISLFICIYK